MRQLRGRAAAAFLFAAVMFAAASIGVRAAEKNVIASAEVLEAGEWEEDPEGLRFLQPDGTYVKDAWIRVGEDVYRIDEEGYAERGWFDYNGKRYYASKKHKIYYGRWLNNKTGSYYLLGTGECVTNCWKKIGGKTYYFGSSGKKAVNMRIGDYYVNASGARVTSKWKQIGGKKYYFGEDGRLIKKEWIETDGSYYYVQADGSMAADKWIGMYYVGKDGARLEKAWVDGYWLNEDGMKIDKKFDGKYIYVGDSRTEYLKRVNDRDDILFLSQIGSGYRWLAGPAERVLRFYLDRNPKVKVVMAHGVNDFKIDKYIAFYQGLMRDYKDTEFYFLSVNPVNYAKLHESGITRIKYPMIEDFNRELKKTFGNRYLDCFSYLSQTGYETVDGLHYTNATSLKICKYILKMIQ